MAHVLNDRVKETTTTTGTGTINLDGAETGFESFVSAIGDSNSTYYAIAHSTLNEFEIGIGTVTDASPDTLTRTTVISSTNSDALVNFSAGIKDVFCTLPASKAVFFDESSGSSDVAIGSRGTNPMGISYTGTVLAVSEQTGTASVQVDGGNAGRLDFGVGGTALFRMYTDTSNYTEFKRTTDHPIIFLVNNAETARFTSSGMQFAASKNISNASGDFTLDVVGDITFDADGGNVKLSDDGLLFTTISRDVANTVIKVNQSDGDLVLKGNDGGSEITALTVDMSEAGTATFNGNVGIGSTPPTTIRNDIHDTEHALQVGRAAMLFSDSGLTTDLQNNSHLNNSDQRVAMSGTLGGSLYAQYNGAHTWYTAAAVAAPNVQSMTARMALDISGNLVVDNNVTAYGTPSDIKLKEDIEVIDNAVDKVKQLKGITYTLKSDGNRLTGLIAQDLEKVLPEAVYTSKTIANEKEGEVAEEHLAIRYGNTVGLLVEAIKEQQEQIDTLNDYVKLQSATIMDMERRLNELEDK